MSSQLKLSQGIHETQWLGCDAWIIIEPWGEIVIAKMGAQVLHYQPVAQLALFWQNTKTGPLSAGFSEKSKLQNKREPIRAGAPLCWPWFGAHERDSSQPSHGFARVCDWKIESCLLQSLGSEKTTLRFIPNIAISEVFTVSFEVEVSNDKLTMTLETVNHSSMQQRLTQAIHSYFAVSDSQKVPVQGLKGCDYFDKLSQNSRAHQVQELCDIDAIDSIFVHDSTVVLVDKGLNRKLIIEKSGSGSTVVWNPGSVAEQYDILEKSRKFVCVEAANTAHEKLGLSPGQCVKLMQSIRIEPLL